MIVLFFHPTALKHCRELSTKKEESVVHSLLSLICPYTEPVTGWHDTLQQITSIRISSACPNRYSM